MTTGIGPPRAQAETARKATPVPRRGAAPRDADLFDLAFVPLLLVVLIGIFASQSDTFLTARNITQILIAASGLAIAAAGTTFVVISGELNLRSAPMQRCVGSSWRR